MNVSITSAAQASFLAWALVTVAACAANQTPVTKAQPEVLPDGNLLDPEPTADERTNLLSVVRTNMVMLKGGTFEMGDWGPEVNKNGLPFDGSRDSKPLHKVTLSRFYIGKYPVIYAEFDVFTAARRLPRINQDNFAKSYRKPNNPAGVTWQGAKDYCQWLAQLTGQRFDLPTEAQWEYAARSGGKRHVYPTDNGESEPGRNLPSYEQEKAAGGLVAVSSFPPNQAGIYYMSAGVHEFTNDWYDPKYYEKSPTLNPTGPATGTTHVARGYHGSDFSAMTFKRWGTPHEDLTGTWTLYGTAEGKENRKIPFTQYSNNPDNAFRCVLNQDK
jgi:formylglycine-generating enzyme required for sulfatase activity